MHPRNVIDAPSDPVRNPVSRVLVASMVGTTIEYYDFYVYATAAVLVFPHLFFPAGDPTASLLASLAVFGAGMVARPLGAIWFGHLGDRTGRKAALTGSLLVMGLATFLIGLLPGQAVIGWLAPLFLVVLRLAQGFAIGGEWSGAVVVATENAPQGQRGLFGTFPQMGAPLGFILANGVFLAVATAMPAPSGAFLGWGWRLPFLLAGALAAVGLWVRLRLVESAAFRRAEADRRIRRLPVASLFRECGGTVVLGALCVLATTVLFFSMTTFSLSYGRAPRDAALPGLGYDYVTFLLLLIFGALFFAGATLASGLLIDRFGRRPVLMAVTAGIAVFGLVWVPLLSAGLAGLLVWLVVGFTLMGLTFGPMGALLSELFPSHLRYTGAGMSYNIASMLGASTAPFITVALWRMGQGSPVWPGVYLSAVALVSLAALYAGHETRHRDILG